MKERESVKDEIRKEFQLERMVLFSDAVFAIVITLMAIEIHIPELEVPLTADVLSHELHNLIPVIIAYTVSFFFIGQTWYQHLKIFSLLKDYDKGLVFRNLFMLFFIGLFPFGATVMAKMHDSIIMPVSIYFFVIFTSKGAQLILQHYILYRRPNLRVNVSVDEEVLTYKKSVASVSILAIAFTLVIVSYSFFGNTDLGSSMALIFVPIPIIVMYFRRRIEKKSKLKIRKG